MVGDVALPVGIPVVFVMWPAVVAVVVGPDGAAVAVPEGRLSDRKVRRLPCVARRGGGCGRGVC